MDTLEAFVSLVVAICYLIGIVTFIYGVIGFKKNSTNPQQFPLANCFMNLLSGTFFLSMPTIYSVLKRSSIDRRWSERNALALDPHVGDIDIGTSFFGRYLPDQSGQAVIGFIYLIGLISFARGINKLKYVGLNQMNSPGGGGLGSALSHMIGGMFVMNIVDVSCVIGETVGMDNLCMR